MYQILQNIEGPTLWTLAVSCSGMLYIFNNNEDQHGISFIYIKIKSLQTTQSIFECKSKNWDNALSPPPTPHSLVKWSLVVAVLYFSKKHIYRVEWKDNDT